MHGLKIGTSWVRGIVGEALIPELIVDFACAFGTWAEGAPVVIGRDSRRSSTMFRSAVIAGLLSPGCEIIDLGVCSTPLVSFGVREWGCGGGISITGSHNNYRWNALKFIGPDGTPLNPVRSRELFDIYHGSNFLTASRDHLQSVETESRVTDRYVEHLLSCLNTDLIQQQEFSLAIDFCNGACFSVAKKFFGELHCEMKALNEEPADAFAHSPEPTKKNMSQLSTFVQGLDVDLGAAVNVDGDRVAFVTEAGIPLSSEVTLPVVARNRLSRRPAPVVTNLSTSRMIDEVAKTQGQIVLRTAVGESHVIDRGFDEGATIVGEGSGGVSALPVTSTFDSLLALGMVLETMATEGKTLAELAADLPRFHMRKGAIRCLPVQAYRTLDTLRRQYADSSPDLSDGLRVDWEDAWLHIRSSSTEPVLRIIVEAKEKERAISLFRETELRTKKLVQRN
jgi:phosphomannomutase